MDASGTYAYINIRQPDYSKLITLFCYRSLWNMRSYIHVNLCLSLMAAQFLFLVGIGRTENQVHTAIVKLLRVASPL